MWLLSPSFCKTDSSLPGPATNINVSSRPGDEEPAPRGYIVKKEHSKLTEDELILWMQRELPPRMQLVAGAAFIDTIPISSVSWQCFQTRMLLTAA